MSELLKLMTGPSEWKLLTPEERAGRRVARIKAKLVANEAKLQALAEEICASAEPGPNGPN